MDLPENGFYRHYKHDPAGAPFNYMYEVLGTTRDSETKALSVLYRPLYANTYLPLADYCVRPLDMFMENVEKDGKTMPRFTKITDPEIIRQLKEVRSRMYS